MSLIKRLFETKPQKSPGTWRSRKQRPPWTDEDAIKEYCTSCGACIDSCPEGILFAGPGGTPVLQFSAGQCTFCKACAEACEEPVFRSTTETAWNLLAVPDETCLLRQGVSCRSCTDACDQNALLFDLQSGAVGSIMVDANACTGCGACVSICPVNAITLRSSAF